MKVRTLLFVALVFGVGACEDYDRIADNFRRKQQIYDPTYLWSAEVISPQKAGPVTVCADTALREGFLRPLPNEDGKQCALTEWPTGRPDLVKMRCTLNDRYFDIQTAIKGDPLTAFEVDYSIAGGGINFHQVRRYKRLGPCPAGWDIGDNTDRRGRLRRNALK